MGMWMRIVSVVYEASHLVGELCAFIKERVWLDYPAFNQLYFYQPRWDPANYKQGLKENVNMLKTCNQGLSKRSHMEVDRGSY